MMDARRLRAESLRQRYPFAAEMMTLYLALLDVWEEVAGRLGGQRPADPAGWAVEHVLPLVVKATGAYGPPALADAAGALLEQGRLEEPFREWLAGKETPPVERYLARASLRPVTTEGGTPDGTARCGPDTAHTAHTGARAASCPRCGGQPQLSLRPLAGDPLVSTRRQLLCAACQNVWDFSGNACPSCGETTGSQRTMYTDPAEFPHLRVDACATCRRYLIDVDLNRDRQAVPEVDELAALPLDLYATEHGLTKITPNLMGF
jgi:FdhE protein